MNPVYPKYYRGWICVAAWSHTLGSSQSCAPSLFPIQTLMRSSGLRSKCPGPMAGAYLPARNVSEVPCRCLHGFS